jgi:hypothetical protein
LFLALAVALAGPVVAQSDKFNQPVVDRPASGNADQAEGARILSEFRQAGIAGDYWLEFELRVLPRKGPERVVTGTLLGTKGPDGPLSRLAAGGERWLIASGPHPSAWLQPVSGPRREIGPGEAGQVIAGTGVTVFELQMPFLYWSDFTYEGQGVVRSRPADSFVLRPPAGSPPPVPGLTGVRLLLDAQFQALVRADLLGADGVAFKSIALLDLKKVGEQWLVKTIDVRDLRSRDKTRFAIMAAALDLNLPDDTFTPDNLETAPPAVPPGKVVRF